VAGMAGVGAGPAPEADGAPGSGTARSTRPTPTALREADRRGRVQLAEVWGNIVTTFHPEHP
jgi:hypothetical protein